MEADDKDDEYRQHIVHHHIDVSKSMDQPGSRNK
jgi:hypothetical protein